ncbi:MAG: FAD-binding protein, partial [Pseudomonadales bacterium]|nr:FAD-binding protein [Pseudomonadales bacterium]
ITEATLRLADNSKIERKTTLMKVGDYYQHFSENVRDNQDVIFHNGDLYPPDYENVLDVSWYKTDKPLTIEDRLIARDEIYNWGPRAADFVADYDIGKAIRENIIDPVYYAFDRVVWRNWEASYDVRELEPQSRKEKTYVLREYFVPVKNFDAFVPVMKEIFNRNNANIINVSIRHAHAAPENLLSWAREEVFAFVVYYRQGTDQASKDNVETWSIEMIDAVIAAGGTYYLPYQIYASVEKFQVAYPRANEFFALKKKLDPTNRFVNQLWKQYYPGNHDKNNIGFSEQKKK